MNKKQLSEHIGNIDDRLVEQAENIPNYRQLHHRQIIKHFLTIAAAFVLMVCSFSAGAFAFACEIVVEVPVEQATEYLGMEGEIKDIKFVVDNILVD